MATRSRAFLAAALSVGLLAACSGAPRPQSINAGGPEGSGAGESPVDTPQGDGTVATDPVLVDESGRPIPTTPGGRGASASGTGGPAAVPGAGGVVPGPTSPGAGGPGGPAGPAPIVPANLFTAAQDRIGITDSKITLCGHAALIFASAFNIGPEDLNVYWSDLKARGGIYKRNVEITFEDDRYDPAEAEAAAERCRAKNPFFVLGGIGFDQIPNVRVWAERNKMLYFHHIAVGAGSENKKYSFTPQPTVEQVGVAFGEYIGSKHQSKKVGIVYRNSDYWSPGYKSGVAELKKRKVAVTSELPVEKNQAVYNAQILDLKNKGAEVVWLWENALAAGEFIKQAYSQDYAPTFVVFPFQTTLDLIGDNQLRSKIEGVGTWSAHRAGGYGATQFAQHGYDAELARFEAAMAKYRPNVKPNDILWQVWLANKGIEDLFVRCGQDCTRNKLAGLILGGYKATVNPNCEADFSRGNPYRGGWSFITMEAYDSGPELNYRTTRWCSEHLG